MKKLAFVGMAATLCVSTIAVSAMYTFTPHAQRLVDKELGELMVRLYLNPESAYLQQTGSGDYKELCMVLPSHEWERIGRSTVWQNIGTVLWPTLCGSLCGALIGVTAGGVLGLTAGCWVARDVARSVAREAPLVAVVLLLGFGGIYGIYIMAGLVGGVAIGAIIGGVIGFVCGLISGIRKLFQRKRVERCDGFSSLRGTTEVAVCFPVLAHQLKQLIDGGVEPYAQASVDDSGFSVRTSAFAQSSGAIV